MTLYALGAIYAVIFWIIASKHPKIALMLIIATSPFQNDISGGGPLRFSIAEVNLLLSVPILLLKKRRLSLGPFGPAIYFYLLVSLGCTLLSWRSSSPVALMQMVVYMVVAVMVFSGLPKSDADFRFALNGLVCVAVVMACAVIIKRSGFVWHLHKNGVGASLGAATIVGTELWFAATSRKRKRLLFAALGIMAAGLFFTLSRGAWFGCLVGILILIALRGQFRLLLRVSVVLVPLVAICWAYLPESSREYSTSFSSEGNLNIKLRYDSVDYARNIFLSSPITGVGVGLRKEYDATNIIWCTLAETGIVGLIALIVLHVSILRTAWKIQKNLDRSSTLYSGVALSAALVISRFMHGMVDHYWGRGPTTVVWAAVGMALFAYFAKRRYIMMQRLARYQQAGKVPTKELNSIMQVANVRFSF